MATKGEKTRKNVIEQAMQLFSVKGYYHTSVNDLLAATGLTKGGLYCHFRSKEELWSAVYEDAVAVWRQIVFRGMRDVRDPVHRIEKTVENVLINYLGEEVFVGGCFFVNMLVEMPGQSAEMNRRILRGFIGFSRLFQRWLREADENGRLKPGLNFQEVANFIVISLNGAATFYTSSRDPVVLRQTLSQLRFYIHQLRSAD